MITKSEALASAIAALHSEFKGRHLFNPELLTVSRQFARDHEFELRDYAALLSGWPTATAKFKFTYGKYCVNALAEFGRDGAKNLQTVGCDQKLEWHFRQAALLVIAQRPENLDLSGIAWPLIMKVVEDPSVTGEVRAAALRAIWKNEREFLPKICDLFEAANLADSDNWLDQKWYDGKRLLLMAITALGGTTRIASALELLYLDNWRKKQDAEEAIASNIRINGGDHTIANVLAVHEGLSYDNKKSIWENLKNHSNDIVVRWALDRQTNAESPATSRHAKQVAEVCFDQLSSDNWGIRKQAADFLANAEYQAGLRKLLADPNQDRVARSWAAYTLSRIGAEPEELFPKETRQDDSLIWRCPIEIPIDDKMRNAIVYGYGHAGRDNSDIRFRLEWRFCDPYTKEHANEDRKRFVECLKQAGIKIESAVECGEHHHSGGGTYWVLGLDSNDHQNNIYLSTLGRYYYLVKVEDPQPIENAVNNAGFIQPPKDLLKQTFPNLNVYFFGTIEPLSIYDLLFFWQD